jgi:hypothetical protein
MLNKQVLKIFLHLSFWAIWLIVKHQMLNKKIIIKIRQITNISHAFPLAGVTHLIFFLPMDVIEKFCRDKWNVYFASSNFVLQVLRFWDEFTRQNI